MSPETAGTQQRLEAFRAEAGAWIDQNLPDDWRRPAFPQTLPPTDEDVEGVRMSRGWHERLYAGGWVAPGWPVEYGGRGLDLAERMVLAEELAMRRAPVPIGFQGIDLLGPTLIEWATDEQQERFLPGILSGEEIWCQGYSEPGAGSDLASISTTARRDGDEYIVNGQKVWTSFGERASWCFLVVRTGERGSRHKGLSFLLADMDTPGIEWRPVRQITGTNDFGELFLTDARVPFDQRVGEEGDGWRVAMASLGHERILSANVAHLRSRLDALIALAQVRGADERTRQRIAAAACAARGLEGVQAGALRRAQAEDPQAGTWASMLKLGATELRQDLAEIAASMLGPDALLDPGAAGDVIDVWRLEILEARACTIYAGTSEVQRNIIGERGLGLPREPG